MNGAYRMTGLDFAVAASRPRGIADALAVNLAIQITRNEGLEARAAEQAAEIKRLTNQIDGLLDANDAMWRERCHYLGTCRALAAELREARS